MTKIRAVDSLSSLIGTAWLLVSGFLFAIGRFPLDVWWRANTVYGIRAIEATGMNINRKSR